MLRGPGLLSEPRNKKNTTAAAEERKWNWQRVKVAKSMEITYRAECDLKNKLASTEGLFKGQFTAKLTESRFLEGKPKFIAFSTLNLIGY